VRLVALQLFVTFFFLPGLSQPRSQSGSISMFLQLQTDWALDSLQGLTDVDLHRCALGLEISTGLEVRLGLIGPTQPGVGEATKVVTTWILASLFNRLAEQLVGLVVLACEVGMYPLTIQFL
jgi:hypothetical protein